MQADMNDRSVYKLGGAASIIVGISYTVAAVTAVLMPPAMAGLPSIQSPFVLFEENSTMLLANYWALLISAVFALAVVPAVSNTVMHRNEGWVRWTSTLATIAFAVVILDNYWALVYTAPRAQAFMTGSEAVRATLTVPGAPQWIDVQGWLANGAFGLWALVVSLLALRGGLWPKGLAYLGIGGAILLFLGLAATVIPGLFLSGMGNIISGIGALYAPIWFIWMGLFLYRRKAQ